ncbi:winged helix-turn-helix transcriptional regulator [Thermoleophilum album]|uniref:winged helix-turn-helix transcriptional regulator n=1 Tax=Thermoleophilum album TaxID=29539 RepID=UPI00237CEBFC|nr:winged helix-turn-helix transcriptional regulator [Thermoleophilum album]WDT93912.1 winged helix-turn-helix transcriptional regulator [Thermoleophilum album]
MADFLDEKIKEMEARLRELRPLVDEYKRLEKALAALRGTAARPQVESTRRTRRRTTGGRRGPRRPRGSRTQEALELISQNPGIKVRELADRMQITPNYVYQLLPKLESEGKVERRDGGIYIKEQPVSAFGSVGESTVGHPTA